MNAWKHLQKLHTEKKKINNSKHYAQTLYNIQYISTHVIIFKYKIII